MFRLTDDNRRMYNTIRSLKVNGNTGALLEKRIASVFVDLYRMGYEGVDPTWIDDDGFAAAAWLAGRDDAREAK